MGFIFRTVTANTQKDRAFKVAAARGWTILADANIGFDATKYGWSFVALNKQGKRVGVIFNARADWSEGQLFPYPEGMDEADFGFKKFCDADVEAVFAVETNYEATECIIARESDFGPAHSRRSRNDKCIKVRTYANPRDHVVNVNLI